MSTSVRWNPSGTIGKIFLSPSRGAASLHHSPREKQFRSKYNLYTCFYTGHWLLGFIPNWSPTCGVSYFWCKMLLFNTTLWILGYVLRTSLGRFSFTLGEQKRGREHQKIVSLLGDVTTLGFLLTYGVCTYVPDVKNSNFTYAKNMRFFQQNFLTFTFLLA